MNYGGGFLRQSIGQGRENASLWTENVPQKRQALNVVKESSLL